MPVTESCEMLHDTDWRSGLLHGDRVIAFQVPESVDVDILKDVEQLEFYLEKNREPILEYLMKYYKRLDEAEI